MIVKIQCSTHNLQSELRYPISPGMRYLADQSMRMKQLEASSQTGTLPYSFFWIIALPDAEVVGYVAEAESVDGIFAPHDGTTESTVVRVEQIEGTCVSFFAMERFGHPVKRIVRTGRIFHNGQCGDILSVCRAAYLRISVQIGDPFSHREPIDNLFTLSDTMAANAKRMGIIDNCFHTEYDPVLVVHFNPVVPDPVFDTGARPSFFQFGNQLTGKGTVELCSEKLHDILGANTDGGMPLYILVQFLQRDPGGEKNIGSEFSLVGYPVVFMPFKHSAQKGVNSSGKTMQDFFPLLMGKRIGNILCSLIVIDADKGVVSFFIADTFSVQLPGQPFVAIAIDLHGIGQPCGESNVHETHMVINKVEVQRQARWIATYESRPVFTIAHGKTAVLFSNGKDTDQPLGYAVATGDSTGLFFFSDTVIEIAIGASCMLSHCHGVCFYFFGAVFNKTFEVFKQKALTCDEVLNRPRIPEKQVSLENDTVEYRYYSGDLLTVFRDEVIHGVLLAECEYEHSISEEGRHFFSQTGKIYATAIR